MSITEKLKGLENELDAEIKKADTSISTIRLQRRTLIGLKKVLNPRQIKKRSK